MAEYIDREKLLDELDKSARHHANNSREERLLFRDRTIVREQPTADVVEQEKIDKTIDEVYKIRNDVLYANGCYEPDDVLDIIDQITKLFEEI